MNDFCVKHCQVCFLISVIKANYVFFCFISVCKRTSIFHVYLYIVGPATVRMVSNSGPPLPMPMSVPPGHMVQQIVDENGILTHVILSPQPPNMMGSPMTVCLTNVYSQILLVRGRNCETYTKSTLRLWK